MSSDVKKIHIFFTLSCRAKMFLVNKSYRFDALSYTILLIFLWNILLLFGFCYSKCLLKTMDKNINYAVTLLIFQPLNLDYCVLMVEIFHIIVYNINCMSIAKNSLYIHRAILCPTFEYIINTNL